MRSIIVIDEEAPSWFYYAKARLAYAFAWPAALLLDTRAIRIKINRTAWHTRFHSQTWMDKLRKLSRECRQCTTVGELAWLMGWIVKKYRMAIFLAVLGRHSNTRRCELGPHWSGLKSLHREFSIAETQQQHTPPARRDLPAAPGYSKKWDGTPVRLR